MKRFVLACHGSMTILLSMCLLLQPAVCEEPQHTAVSQLGIPPEDHQVVMLPSVQRSLGLSREQTHKLRSVLSKIAAENARDLRDARESLTQNEFFTLLATQKNVVDAAKRKAIFDILNESQATRFRSVFISLQLSQRGPSVVAQSKYGLQDISDTQKQRLQSATNDIENEIAETIRLLRFEKSTKALQDILNNDQLKNLKSIVDHDLLNSGVIRNR